MKKYLLFLAILFICYLPAQNLQTFFKDTDAFFKTYVKNGKVDYKSIKKDTAELDHLLSLAEDIKVDVKKENYYKAFWINSYNLLTIKGIIDHYPIKSPLDVKGFFDTVKYSIADESPSLL